MDYFAETPDFDFAQDTATKLLLNQNISALFVDIRNFDLGHNIIIDSMQNYCTIAKIPLDELQLEAINGALTIKKRGVNLILYDESESNERRKHWGIVHEVGHVYLGHSNDNRKSEIEAHFFTAQVVTPEIVLWEIAKKQKKITASDVYERFNISLEAAQKRINTLCRRGCYSSADIDRALLTKYLPIMENDFGHLAS